MRGHENTKRWVPAAGLALALALGARAGSADADERPQTPPPADGRTDAARTPPPAAYEDCRGHVAGDVVSHATREGRVSATCVESPGGLVARPQPAGGRGTPSAREAGDPAPRYSIEQAVSDRAQLDTIAFDGLAFLTGTFADDTFLPPGKVSDYFGFQYMRDVDAREGGHNTSFLTRIATNVLAILDDGQRAELVALARDQQGDIHRFAEMRFPLIAAFRRTLEGRPGLDRSAVIRRSAELYAVDGRLAVGRARVMGRVLRGLGAGQRAALDRLKFGDSASWPDAPEALDRRTLPHEVHVAVMTYASEMFSWRNGSLEADTYFCPERHGMYFGGFGMKTAPAMGRRDYSISTTLTGDRGEGLLAALDGTQRRTITALVEQQRPALDEIVRVRRAIATELRRLQTADLADESTVTALSRRYGALDGEMSYLYATAFASVGGSLTAAQRRALAALRGPASGPRGPYLYSTPIAMPEIAGVDALFAGAPGARRSSP
ncbi:MAG: hypothetical protein U0599_14900 [Vicinamibacteria bacterium]